jgi:hypothetical protein
MPSLMTTGAAIVPAGLFAISFLVVSAGIGRRLLLWISVPDHGPLAERIAAAILLGAGVVQYVPFALGALGYLSPASLRIGLAAIALISLPDAWTTLVAIRSALRTSERPPTWVLAWLCALLPGLLVAFLLTLTPTLDADGLGYHLTVPKRWLLAGSLRYLPTYPYSNTPMGVEMLFMSGMAIGGDTAAKLLHFSLGMVGAWALYLAGKRLAGRMVGAVAASAFLFGPMGVGALLGWAYLEGATSAALIGSALAWLVWYQERDRAWLRCAALLAGIGVCFKITAGLFPVALGVLTLWVLTSEARAQKKPVLAEVLSILRLAPLLLVPALPWLLRSAVVTGNPLFPMGAQWIPSRDFSAKLAGKFESYNRYMVWGVTLGPSWTLERRKLFFLAVALALLVVGVFIASRRRTQVARSTTLVILGTLLVQLAAVGLYKRYWIPVFSVFQLPMIALFVEALSARWVRSALVTVTALLSLMQAKISLGTVDNDVPGLLKTAFGLEDQRQFLLDHMPLFPLYERANSEEPAPSGIGLSQYCGGFYLDRPTFCADIPQDSLRYTAWPTFVSDVRRLGITHFIAPRSWAVAGSKPAMEGGNTSMLVRESEHDCVGLLLREHAKLLASASDQGLYALDLASLH